MALLRARKSLTGLQGENPDQDAGIRIVERAVEEPLRQIVRNAGAEPAVVVQRVLEGEGNFGYNAATGEYGDLVAMGVLDPRKVTRAALQNAASIASLILTTDCMIAQVAGQAGRAARGRDGLTATDKEGFMANITRYDPFEDFFKDFGKGFWVKPFAVSRGDRAHDEDRRQGRRQELHREGRHPGREEGRHPGRSSTRTASRCALK